MERFDLQRFRKDKNLTQKDLTDVLSCSQPFISSVEKGNRPLPHEMMVILQSKYGYVNDYIINEITGETDEIRTNMESLDVFPAGADVFSRQIIKMMNEKLIAPYSLLAEKDKEIEKLNREIGKLKAQLEASKKTDAQEGDNATCAVAK
jgi:transcriptional regulator with XRE-family HTH domain